MDTKIETTRPTVIKEWTLEELASEMTKKLTTGQHDQQTCVLLDSRGRKRALNYQVRQIAFIA